MSISLKSISAVSGLLWTIRRSLALSPSTIPSMLSRMLLQVLSGACNLLPATPPSLPIRRSLSHRQHVVWTSAEALRNYVYTSRHIDAFRDRARWFEKMDQPHYCLWWIPAGHIPTVSEGREAWSTISSTVLLLLVLQAFSRSRARARTSLIICRNMKLSF
jgi:hypothetical protein